MRRILILALAGLLLGGCSGNNLETLLVTSDCVFNGPEQVEEGPIRLTLNLEGLGETGAVVVQLLDGHTYDELTAHFNDGGATWEDRPDWVRVKATVTIAGTPTSDRAESTLATLDEGSHGVICIRYWDDDSAVPVAELEVGPAG